MRKYLPIIGVLLAAAWISPPVSFAGGSMEGKTAPKFTLKTPEGTDLTFDPAKSKLTVIDFWAVWCVPCMQSLPELNSLYNDYKDKGLNVIAVNVPPEEPRNARDTAKRKGLVIPIVMGTRNMAATYSIDAIPRTFLVDDTGKIILDVTGWDQSGSLRKKVESILVKKSS